MGEHPIEKDVERILRSHSSIGLLLSGGLDSAGLGYLLVHGRNLLGTNNSFEYIILPSTDGALTHAMNVADWLDSKAKVQAKRHVMGKPELHHTQRVGSALKEAMRQLTHIDLFLNAANKTPDEDVPGGPLRFNSINPKVYLPFFTYTKDELVRLYIKHDLDALFKITHTCTETTNTRCRICWQCKERAWAFNKCGYTDPGTL